jgi:hypothetical protein
MKKIICKSWYSHYKNATQKLWQAKKVRAA